MKKFSMIIAAALLLFAVSLSGCIGGGGTPVPAYTASPNMDPSQIISQKDAESLVGNALKEPLIRPTAPPFVSQAPAATPAPTGTGPAATPAAPTQTPAYANFVMCFYEPAQPGGKFLQVSVMQVTPAMVPSSGQQATQDLSALGQFNAVKGKGPSAVSDPSMRIVTSILGGNVRTVEGNFETVDAFILAPGLHLYYRGYYVVIGVGDPNDSANDAILEKAGQLAVNNIDKILDKAVSTPPPTPTSAS
jgi:hypothetical protein